MKKFAIKNCIESGCWLEGYLEDEEILFRLRVLDFEKLNFETLDFEEELEFDFSEGVLYLLSLEVLNLTKSTIDCDDIKGHLRVVDEEDYCFELVEDDELCNDSEFAETTRLKRFYCGELRPKIKAKGALLFLVPDEETNYSIGLDEGRLAEV